MQLRTYHFCFEQNANAERNVDVCEHFLSRSILAIAAFLCFLLLHFWQTKKKINYAVCILCALSRCTNLRFTFRELCASQMFSFSQFSFCRFSLTVMSTSILFIVFIRLKQMQMSNLILFRVEKWRIFNFLSEKCIELCCNKNGKLFECLEMKIAENEFLVRLFCRSVLLPLANKTEKINANNTTFISETSR